MHLWHGITIPSSCWILDIYIHRQQFYHLRILNYRIPYEQRRPFKLAAKLCAYIEGAWREVWSELLGDNDPDICSLSACFKLACHCRHHDLSVMSPSIALTETDSIDYGDPEFGPNPTVLHIMLTQKFKNQRLKRVQLVHYDQTI
jgi:hypothetical protein